MLSKFFQDSQQAIAEEIVNFLLTHSDKSQQNYQSLLTNINLRQELIQYVFRQIKFAHPNMHKFPSFSLEMRLEIEGYLQTGIDRLLKHQQDQTTSTNKSISLVG